MKQRRSYAAVTLAPNIQTALLAVHNHKTVKVRTCPWHAVAITPTHARVQANGVWLLPTAKEIKGQFDIEGNLALSLKLCPLGVVSLDCVAEALGKDVVGGWASVWVGG